MAQRDGVSTREPFPRRIKIKPAWCARLRRKFRRTHKDWLLLRSCSERRVKRYLEDRHKIRIATSGVTRGKKHAGPTSARVCVPHGAAATEFVVERSSFSFFSFLYFHFLLILARDWEFSVTRRRILILIRIAINFENSRSIMNTSFNTSHNIVYSPEELSSNLSR